MRRLVLAAAIARRPRLRSRPSRFPRSTDHLAVPTSGSGRELEWPQIGLGLGRGIVLMFGFWLAMRLTRTRPVAH